MLKGFPWPPVIPMRSLLGLAASHAGYLVLWLGNSGPNRDIYATGPGPDGSRLENSDLLIRRSDALSVSKAAVASDGPDFFARWIDYPVNSSRGVDHGAVIKAQGARTAWPIR